MVSKTFEFIVEMRVRKHLWLSGPATAEVAEQMLKISLESGMNPNILAKRESSGHPIEQIIGSDFTITACRPEVDNAEGEES